MIAGEVQPHESPCTSASVSMKRPTPEMSMPGMSMPPSGCALRSPPRDDDAADDQREDADRDVDEEDPGPVTVGDEHAAEDRADGGRGGAQRSPEADRRALLARGKAPSTIASEMVSSAAPPTPWPARKAISQLMSGAKPQSSENTVKVTRPNRKTRFWPYRSAMRPMERKNTASTRL